MTNAVDELVESLISATIKKETVWTKGNEQFEELLEQLVGNSQQLYTFFDKEVGANVLLVSYQYYEGEVEADEFLKVGYSLFVLDAQTNEVLNEVTDEDATTIHLFERLMEAIEK